MLLPHREVLRTFGDSSSVAASPIVGIVGRRRALAAAADEDYKESGGDEEGLRFEDEGFDQEEDDHLSDGADAADDFGRKRSRSDFLSEEVPSIEQVNVANSALSCGYLQIDLPKAWVDKLQRSTLEMVADTMCTMVQGKLKDDPNAVLAIKTLDRRSQQDMRLSWIIQNLNGAPNVVACFDSITFLERSFLLLEAIQMSSLRNRLDEDEARAQAEHAAVSDQIVPPIIQVAEAGHLAMPLEDVLPLFIDMLRGLVEMARRDMVHAYLSESDVLIRDGRALIWGFGRAWLDTTASELGHWGWDDMVGSAFRHSPEMTQGRPTGLPNSVWAAGLILSRMCLGEDVTKGAVLSEFPLAEDWLWDSTEDGRERIRGLIRKNFEIKDHPSFQSLDKDIQRLLAGMLEKDAGKRWNAYGSLKFALSAAKRRQIEVPAPRQAPHVPHGWMDWQ